jgi:4-hydroxyproline epimerase
LRRISVIDSHTGGEPTRVVIGGFPDLGRGSIAERLQIFRTHYDHVRSAVVCEPRGSDVIVGAVLQPSPSPDCAAGTIFFNNVGYLGMCGHGTIGLITTMAHLDLISPGVHRIETPVGRVQTTLHDDGEVSVQNVPAYRYRANVAVGVDGFGVLRGDIAWGGNWFFLVGDHGQELSLVNVRRLTDFTTRIRQALERDGITGEDGAEIDHVELFASSPIADARNFVLCPGMAYDRSPCGTGTSAKLACLYADGKLQPGDIWRQESITGSVFEGSITLQDTAVIPTIRGRAYLTAEASLLLDEDDPLCWGVKIPPSS